MRRHQHPPRPSPLSHRFVWRIKDPSGTHKARNHQVGSVNRMQASAAMHACRSSNSMLSILLFRVMLQLNFPLYLPMTFSVPVQPRDLRPQAVLKAEQGRAGGRAGGSGGTRSQRGAGAPVTPGVEGRLGGCAQPERGWGPCPCRRGRLGVDICARRQSREPGGWAWAEKSFHCVSSAFPSARGFWRFGAS